MIRLALFFLVLFLAAVFDIRKRIIPDWMPFLIARVSLIPSEPVYLTGLFVALPLLIAGITVGGIGGGDIKLMFAAGFLLGWKATVVGFFIGLILGGIYGVICLVRRSHGKNDHFAFGPFLSVGLAIALFCGNIIMNHYIDFIKAAMNPEI